MLKEIASVIIGLPLIWAFWILVWGTPVGYVLVGAILLIFVWELVIKSLLIRFGWQPPGRRPRNDAQS